MIVRFTRILAIYFGTWEIPIEWSLYIHTHTYIYTLLPICKINIMNKKWEIWIMRLPDFSLCCGKKRHISTCKTGRKRTLCITIASCLIRIFHYQNLLPCKMAFLSYNVVLAYKYIYIYIFACMKHYHYADSLFLRLSYVSLQRINYCNSDSLVNRQNQYF